MGKLESTVNQSEFLFEEKTRIRTTNIFGLILFASFVYPAVVAFWEHKNNVGLLFLLLSLIICIIPFVNRLQKTHYSVAIIIHTCNVGIVLYNIAIVGNVLNLYSLFPFVAGISFLNPLPHYKREFFIHYAITFVFHLTTIVYFHFILRDYSRINGQEVFSIVNLLISLLITIILIYLHSNKAVLAQFRLNNQVKETQQLVDKLEVALHEKNILLAEVHHRIKNNLAVVSGMLNWQKSHSDEKRVHDVLNECSNRVMTMALVHKKLYERGDFNEVALNDYVKELCEDIKKTQETNVQLEINVEADPIFIKIDKATPCGLIINEVMTNCIKHAFVKKHGVISVSLKSYKNIVVLIIKDDGIGMPPIEEVKNRNTMGYNLIASLSEQIDGQFEYVNANGTQFALHFPLN
jgi:two-component sensor histidine kinase